MIARSHLLACLALFVLAILASAVLYAQLPDPAPTHWNIHGEADGFGPRWQAAWIFPLVEAAVLGLILVLPVIGPLRQNMAEFRTIYGRICVVLAAMFLAMHLTFLLKAAGYPLQIGATLAIIIGTLLAVLGNWLGKVRRNFFIGIRTPWTLANETVWERTHRIGGRMFVLVGLVVIVTGFFAPDWVCFVVLIGGVSAVTLWAVLYSLFLYRRLGSVDDLEVHRDAQAVKP